MDRKSERYGRPVAWKCFVFRAWRWARQEEGALRPHLAPGGLCESKGRRELSLECLSQGV